MIDGPYTQRAAGAGLSAVGSMLRESASTRFSTAATRSACWASTVRASSRRSRPRGSRLV
jgi:hypothetical protein